MLFNSYEFIFLFLPITVVTFFILGNFSRTLALRWLITASLFFYAWWRPLNVLLIAPSILINFAAARGLQELLTQEKRRSAMALLLLGIAFNVAFLGYFKYANFFVDAVNDVFVSRFFLAHIVLPLGISFITFQKIAFLIDVHSRRVESFTLQDYCLFVLFFPQLIAGPIVHYREMMPQFQRAPCVFNKENVAVGVTLFVFGLCKKAFLADGIAPMVTSIYDQAAAGQSISFFSAWMAAIGFTFQLYFDFSGYTDMALGIARFFGIRLPPNFNSPLRASSIIDFWLRWHMTLTRFLTAYIYNPLTLWLTRRRMAKGLRGFGGQHTTFGAFVILLMFPTILTMCISGLWHGAGYLFILWGLLHGIFLTINHGWRVLVRKLWPDTRGSSWHAQMLGFLLTFVSVVTSMVFFRSSTMRSAIDVVKGMAGINGFELPPSAYARLTPIASWLHSLGITQGPADITFAVLAYWIVALGAIAFFCPNTLQIMARFEPALGVTATESYKVGAYSKLNWEPSLGWAVVMAIIAGVGILHLGGVSEFLYWQF